MYDLSFEINESEKQNVNVALMNPITHLPRLKY
jgi:hypothetical protein